MVNTTTPTVQIFIDEFAEFEIKVWFLLDDVQLINVQLSLVSKMSIFASCIEN